MQPEPTRTTTEGPPGDMPRAGRRQFLAGAAAATLLAALPSAARPQVPAAADATLSLGNEPEPWTVPAGYTGLSYEMAQLSEPDFFSAANTGLVALFRRLSPHGLLRLGGNSSEFCWFAANPQTPAPTLVVPAGSLAQNWMPHRLFRIEPAAVEQLAGFLNATGWHVIYGLNLGHSTPERAATEAAYAAKTLGSRLAFFQIGNEPDFYGDRNNATRGPGWNFTEYAAEWMRFADAVRAQVPGARFGGPDVGSASAWILDFAGQVAPKMGGSLVALTGHYYAEGPPDNPKVTTARLLAGNPEVARSTGSAVSAAQAHGMRYHMTEGNSCYRGGKPGMSNAFASALWAADYTLLLASLGCAGVNLHGGDSRFISAGLGGHNPGLKAEHGSAEHGSIAAPNAFYTPIETELDQRPAPRPVYYGMLLAQQFAAATIRPCTLNGGANLTGYAAAAGHETRVALINKDDAQSVTVAVAGPWRKAGAWRLTGPSLSATGGITLGGSAVADDGSWHPREELLAIGAGGVTVKLPPASAALVFLR